MSMHGESPLRK